MSEYISSPVTDAQHLALARARQNLSAVQVGPGEHVYRHHLILKRKGQWQQEWDWYYMEWGQWKHGGGPLPLMMDCKRAIDEHITKSRAGG